MHKKPKSGSDSKLDAGEIERHRVSRRLGKFNYKTCPTYQILKDLFGPRRSKTELLSLATCLCLRIPELKLDREAKRRKCVLIKWFDDNIELIRPYLQFYMFTDEKLQKIEDDPVDNSSEGLI